MATGDLKNCGTRLQSLLRTSKYPKDVNYSFLFYGSPQEFLPLLHYIFLEYSLPFTKQLISQGYEMSGKSDKEFIDTVYKVLRDEFQYIPKLSKAKFFSNGYTEQKLILTNTIFTKIIEKKRTSQKRNKSTRNNKENVRPAQQNVEMRDKEEKKDEIPLSEPHTPIRQAPVPDMSQQPLLQSIEDSFLEIEASPVPSTHPESVKFYSEKGAREVYALDHHMADPNEIIDSTPTNVITNVQIVPIMEDKNLSVTVQREISFEDEVSEVSCAPPAEVFNGSTVELPAQDETCDTTILQPKCCSHGQELSEIKQMLLEFGARLDILESKAKRMDGRFPDPSGMVLPAPVISATPAVAATPIAPVTTPTKLNELSSNEQDTTITDSDDDIRTFLASVHHRLDTTRSFLRSYDTS